MDDLLQPVPSLTCQHLAHLDRHNTTLKRLKRPAAKASKQPPRPLQAFQEQYYRIREQVLGTTPR